MSAPSYAGRVVRSVARLGWRFVGWLPMRSDALHLGFCFCLLRSFVYGDLKAENVCVTAAGHVKLADFGAVRPITDQGKNFVRRFRSLQSIGDDLRP
jgi:hypothetical protein